MCNSFSGIEEAMNREEQYKQLVILKEEINRRLQNTDFDTIKELILYLNRSPMYSKLVLEDTQLAYLQVCSEIWLEEKRRQECLDVEDIFFGVNTLERLEEKYYLVKRAGLRIENRLSEADCEEAIDCLIDKKVSGIAIGIIIAQSTGEVECNLLTIADYLKAKGQLITAITLLQYAEERYPDNSTILLQQADCWMEGQQWRMAYDCLQRIKQPKKDVQELIMELDKVL